LDIALRPRAREKLCAALGDQDLLLEPDAVVAGLQAVSIHSPPRATLAACRSPNEPSGFPASLQDRRRKKP
jgi:hypothetical protein